VEGLREAMERRPEPSSKVVTRLVFVTRSGTPWSKDTADYR
jgi:hypothetical protein